MFKALIEKFQKFFGRSKMEIPIDKNLLYFCSAKTIDFAREVIEDFFGNNEHITNDYDIASYLNYSIHDYYRLDHNIIESKVERLKDHPEEEKILQFQSSKFGIYFRNLTIRIAKIYFLKDGYLQPLYLYPVYMIDSVAPNLHDENTAILFKANDQEEFTKIYHEYCENVIRPKLHVILKYALKEDKKKIYFRAQALGSGKFAAGKTSLIEKIIYETYVKEVNNLNLEDIDEFHLNFNWFKHIKINPTDFFNKDYKLIITGGETKNIADLRYGLQNSLDILFFVENSGSYYHLYGEKEAGLDKLNGYYTNGKLVFWPSKNENLIKKVKFLIV